MDHPATHETYIQLRALLIQARDNHPGLWLSKIHYQPSIAYVA